MKLQSKPVCWCKISGCVNSNCGVLLWRALLCITGSPPRTQRDKEIWDVMLGDGLQLQLKMKAIKGIKVFHASLSLLDLNRRLFSGAWSMKEVLKSRPE